VSRPSYATENWLRTQLRLREQALTALVVALRPVIDDVREGAKYDAAWEAVEKAFDNAKGYTP
jgi:hypothetical protein